MCYKDYVVPPSYLNLLGTSLQLLSKPVQQFGSFFLKILDRSACSKG